MWIRSACCRIDRQKLSDLRASFFALLETTSPEVRRPVDAHESALLAQLKQELDAHESNLSRDGQTVAIETEYPPVFADCTVPGRGSKDGRYEYYQPVCGKSSCTTGQQVVSGTDLRAARVAGKIDEDSSLRVMKVSFPDADLWMAGDQMRQTSIAAAITAMALPLIGVVFAAVMMMVALFAPRVTGFQPRSEIGLPERGPPV
jgi:hypothetical protein